MFFSELRDALLETLRSRVRNGEVTERSLARLVGVSQPHIHNILKGVRSMSPEMMDSVLYQLRLSVFDLVDQAALTTYLDRENPKPASHSYLPVLEGKVGPGHSWPSTVETHEHFPVTASALRRMWHPVVALLGFDVRMHPTFADDDRVLLDQSFRARTEFDPEALYLIKRGRVGLLRRIRIMSGAVYVVSDDSIDRPSLWERLPVEGHHMLHFIRARATLLARETEWV